MKGPLLAPRAMDTWIRFSNDSICLFDVLNILLLRPNVRACTLKSKDRAFAARSARDRAAVTLKRLEIELERRSMEGMHPFSSFPSVESLRPLPLEFGPSTTCNLYAYAIL